MSTYREQFARQEELRASLPKREYMSNEEFRKHKSALTRARNSGDPLKVLKAVETAVQRFNETVWVDDWAMWRVALEDAASKAGYKARHDQTISFEEQERLFEIAEELQAASYVLFPY